MNQKPEYRANSVEETLWLEASYSYNDIVTYYFTDAEDAIEGFWKGAWGVRGAAYKDYMVAYNCVPPRLLAFRLNGTKQLANMTYDRWLQYNIRNPNP